ncbi:MAG: hypothetical protein A3D31_11955 [Candidatus Fluviicola riflensis]|nr:MAG: hypothetical protein CHH17_16385 [Candidatus Fluviicola riflensis]OGS77699.1 MAG: hypothetical protein A3D31_11955 [Candidatus Fluviicola riflensis]OGS84282.1 MAG: hypothetical protein A3E30_13365 [Fluviicola sp. RIFCSPHIGHO2_12_FULL_43_24]OGS84765.1 MAG: hypothetical protein A2724_08890 [Fluviicola sp. RIFCSPHIGHO2_01_FULL_43_53]
MNTILKFGFVLAIGLLSSVAYSQEPGKAKPLNTESKPVKTRTEGEKTGSGKKTETPKRAEATKVKAIPAKKAAAKPVKTL